MTVRYYRPTGTVFAPAAGGAPSSSSAGYNRTVLRRPRPVPRNHQSAQPLLPPTALVQEAGPYVETSEVYWY